MSIADDSSSNAAARYRPWIATWGAILAILFAFGWKKSAENARERRAEREWQTLHQQLTADGQAEWARFTAHLQSLQIRPGVRQLLENELNGGQPFEFRREGTDDVYDWTDPKYGFQVQFRFHDGELRGWNGNWGTGQLMALYPQPSRVTDKNATERVRRAIVRAGVWTWLAALVMWIFWSRRRVLAAQVMLAAALACGMAWLVHPLYEISWQGVFSNDSLFWAALMIVVSVYWLAVTLAAHSTPELEMPRVRFGLRWLLLVVAAAAILLAAGPFGFVVFNVALAGCLLFGIVYYRRRSWLKSAA